MNHFVGSLPHGEQSRNLREGSEYKELVDIRMIVFSCRINTFTHVNLMEHRRDYLLLNIYWVVPSHKDEMSVWE